MSRVEHRLWTFHGGLHLPEHKSESTAAASRQAALPELLTLPLQQHIGEPAEALVKPGDRILKGQLLAAPKGYVSAAVHAPSSGTVEAVEARPVPHPSGLSAPCIVIRTDGEERWDDLPPPLTDFAAADPVTLRERIRWAGIVGLGGAGFPAGVKLNPGPAWPIHTLIINGAECEPYITSDDMLMREQADRILTGAAILKHILDAGRCLIGIEDNKPEAIARMRAEVAAHEGIEVVEIPTLYPSGGEKQLIRILTGKEVPSNGIPAQIGVVCQNVGTAAAVTDAVIDGKPLISRMVTLTGGALKQPGNFRALIGTPLKALIEEAGGFSETPARLIFGGPMMGFSLSDDDLPVIKGCNCIIAATAAEAPAPEPARACIRCGACGDVCPARLLPQQMYWYARAKDFDKLQDYDLFDCIECGCCAHVCPSHIPLVQYYRFAKTEIWTREREKRRADHARQRHEARMERLERLERERKERLRKKKEELGKAPAEKGNADAKMAAIEAAMKRVAAKKAAARGDGKPAEPPSSPSPPGTA